MTIATVPPLFSTTSSASSNSTTSGSSSQITQLGRPSLNQVASSFPVILQAIRLGFDKLSHQRSTSSHRLLPRIVVVRAKTCRLLPTRSAASLSIVVRIIALEFNNRILSRLISSVQLDFFRFFRFFERCSVRLQLFNLNRRALHLSSSSVRLDFGLLVNRLSVGAFFFAEGRFSIRLIQLIGCRNSTLIIFPTVQLDPFQFQFLQLATSSFTAARSNPLICDKLDLE
ncbi:hypothetical protein JCM1841_001397 [Sporobolomyces salmonicolor]